MPFVLDVCAVKRLQALSETGRSVVERTWKRRKVAGELNARRLVAQESLNGRKRVHDAAQLIEEHRAWIDLHACLHAVHPTVPRQIVDELPFVVVVGHALDEGCR